MSESADQHASQEPSHPTLEKKKSARKRAAKSSSQSPEPPELSISAPSETLKKSPKRTRKASTPSDTAASEPPAEASEPVASPTPRRRSAAKSKSIEKSEDLGALDAQVQNPTDSEPPKKRRSRKESHADTPQPSDPAPITSASPSPTGAAVFIGSEASAGSHASAGDSSRKSYPVYVPLHVAKQMQQEGRSAPLAIPASAPEAAEVRAIAQVPPASTAVEWQPGGSIQSPAGSTSVQSSERGVHDTAPTGQRLENRHSDTRGDRHGQDRHDRHGNDRRRGRHDRRRGGGRHEDASDRHGSDSPQELPPPTPEELFLGEGIIEISGKGFGFLRDAKRGFVQNPADIFVSPEMVRKYNLRDGQWIKGDARRGGRGQQMHQIHSVNDHAPELSRIQPAFEELTVINPQEPLRMETKPERYTTRVIDLVSPIGKGQRGLIVAPPRTGKTTLLQHIADAMVKNHPDVKLIMLLVDERPEEVTEIKHTVPTAEIMASSNDMDVRSHTRIAELAIERAKRLVESGRDVFILLDSITRLGRAFNNAMTGGGRTMSGGIDARALEIPRKLFAAARNTEEAGSLTIIATALIETGSRMDELIFQEFKGTGNMELVLDRKISEQRVYPAVDIFQSGTRREELLVPADALQKIHFIRRGLAGCRPMDAIDRLLFYLKKFPTNEQMLHEIRG